MRFHARDAALKWDAGDRGEFLEDLHVHTLALGLWDMTHSLE